jgi:hypothetical protein
MGVEPGAIRITEVLDYFKEPRLVDWKVKMGAKEARRIGREAMKIGSRVDELIKTAPRPVAKPKDSLEVQNCLKAYHRWLDVYRPGSVIPFKRLYARINGVLVTGEPDIIVDDILVDIKCAGRVNKKYWIQVNMYNFLKLQNGMAGHEKLGILRLDKVTGYYDFPILPPNPRLVKVWMGLLDAYMELREEENGTDVREDNRQKAVA